MILLQFTTDCNAIFNEMIVETLGCTPKPHDPTAIKMKAECFAYLDFVTKTGHYLIPKLDGYVHGSEVGAQDISVLAVSRADFNLTNSYVWSLQDEMKPITSLIYVSNWHAQVGSFFKSGKTEQLRTKCVDGKYTIEKQHKFTETKEPVDFFSLAW